MKDYFCLSNEAEVFALYSHMELSLGALVTCQSSVLWWQPTEDKLDSCETGLLLFFVLVGPPGKDIVCINLLGLQDTFKLAYK